MLPKSRSRKIAPSPNSNANPKPNPDPEGGGGRFSSGPIFRTPKKSRQKFEYLENEKSFEGEIKKHFSSLLKGSLSTFPWTQSNLNLENLNF